MSFDFPFVRFPFVRLFGVEIKLLSTGNNTLMSLIQKSGIERVAANRVQETTH
jgi:hypothetical protein